MFDEAEPGLEALFLCPLSDASSSGSLSVRELRRLGPFAFSVVALVSLQKEDGQWDKGKKNQNAQSADISMLHIFSSFLWKSIVGLNTEDDDHIWPLYNWGIHTCCFSSSTTDNVRPVHDRFTKMATLPRAGNLQVCYIHTLGLSWRASFFSLPICYRSGKTAVNCFDAQQHFFLLPHIWVMIKKKNDFMNHSMIISVHDGEFIQIIQSN